QRFMGLEMLSGPQALIPRAETEQLARASIELLQQAGMPQRAKVIDVCTGSGNLAFAIAHHVPDAEVFGTDVCEHAIVFAERNGIHLGLQARVAFCTGDLLASFETPDFLGHVDLIVSNPPYIPSAKVGQADMIICAPPYIRSTKVEQMAVEIADHEPRLAFDGGPFGVTILMRLIEDAPRFLRTGGWLAFEVGLGQGPALTKRLQRDDAFEEVRALADGNGAIRVILARRG
ncbi:MAG TPA: HemK/PrmC family methyltransferase, partial [Rhodanobacter sp.]